MRRYHVLIYHDGEHTEEPDEQSRIVDHVHTDDEKHFDHDKVLKLIRNPRWTASQLEDATKGLDFPPGTTVWDKFVAYNSFYDDMKDVFTLEEILKGAYTYFFNDVDAPSNKIYHYMVGMGRI